jgi:hypothetical protein
MNLIFLKLNSLKQIQNGQWIYKPKIFCAFFKGFDPGVLHELL